ncbi:MAG: hypothetical protein AAGF97_00175 [Planctomycetota bacterium]
MKIDSPQLPHWGIVAVVGIWLLSSGCGRQPDSVTVSHLGLVAQAYEQFRVRHRGAAPQNLAELRTFADGSPLLEMHRIDRFDDLLTSDRDDQPMILLFGKDMIRAEGRAVIGYEAVGRQGNRLVAYEGGVIEECDSEQWEQLIGSSAS